MQHGPLITFHLNLTQGNAVVRYSSKDEAGKAQKSLHMYELLCFFPLDMMYGGDWKMSYVAN